MAKLIIGILIGIVLGGGLTFYMFAGVPRASQNPGAPIQPPDPAATSSAAQIVIKQDFFNEVLSTIFRDMKSPTFQLAENTRSNDGEVRLEDGCFSRSRLQQPDNDPQRGKRRSDGP